MGGLALGSWLLPRLVPRPSKAIGPLKVYAIIEAGIAVLRTDRALSHPAESTRVIAGRISAMPGMLLRGVFLPPSPCCHDGADGRVPSGNCAWANLRRAAFHGGAALRINTVRGGWLHLPASS